MSYARKSVIEITQEHVHIIRALADDHTLENIKKTMFYSSTHIVIGRLREVSQLWNIPYSPALIVHVAYQKEVLTPRRTNLPRISITDREAEILHQLAHGLTVDNLAMIWQVSANIMKSEIRDLMHVFRVGWRQGLIGSAHEAYLLDCEDY